mgnify:CR=1 FL=1|tara:strand:- start:1962 stop:2180 length:219 start_codon:yes stop_codon:yes gene_type:complete
MKLSSQAMGAIMMALQKSLLEQSDIVPMLNQFDFQVNEKDETLVVLNPPTFKIDDDLFCANLEENVNTTGSD